MATKIMFVRHAEKPSDDDSIRGVSAEGKHNPDDLSVRGWQRSGALVRFFAPPNGQFPHPALATPSMIFACAPTDHCKSLRSQHTVLALSEYLNRALNVQYSRHQEKALSEAVCAAEGVVLISWEHNAIPDIANRIVRDETTCPQKWHDSRFDIVWVLDRQPDSEWKFTQIAQMLLPGDLAHDIAAPTWSPAARVTGSEA